MSAHRRAGRARIREENDGRAAALSRAESYFAEALEPRRLLSLNPVGGEFQVNQATAGSQGEPAVASDADGDTVVAWHSPQDGGGFGIYARRYGASGAPQDNEFRVNTFTAGNQVDPSVAVDADGDFVVAWSSLGQDGDGYGVYAQRFDSVGNPRGNEFRVNAITTGRQYRPSVAMDADGDFVVVWENFGQDAAGSYGVYGQRFAADGTRVSGEFRVNNQTAGDQWIPSVAMDAAGGFVVAWQSSGGQDGSGDGVYAKRYDAAGVPQLPPAPLQGTGGAINFEFRVNNTTTANQSAPTVAMSYAGEFVIAWDGRSPNSAGDAYFRRFDALGNAQNPEARANNASFGAINGFRVEAAMDAKANFVIAWTSLEFGTARNNYARHYASDSTPFGDAFALNTTTANEQSEPEVGMDADGDVFVAWQSTAQDGDAEAVIARRFDETTELAGPIVTGLKASGNDVRPGERLVHDVTTLAIQFSESLAIAGGAAGANSASNPDSYRLERDGEDVSPVINGVTFQFNAVTRKYETLLALGGALPDGDYVVSALQNLRDPAGNPLDANQDGIPGPAAPASIPFKVRHVLTTGPESHANVATANNQLAPVTAMAANGNYVVVWTDYGRNAGDVYARLYNASGVPVGGEFRVNSYTANAQRNPDVAMDAAGNFVVIWESVGQDPDGSNGVYAKRYDAAGNELPQPIGVNVGVGDEFHPSNATAGTESAPAIAMNAEGNYVVTWTEEDSPGGGVTNVKGRRFGAFGLVAAAVEFVANTTTIGTQEASDVAISDTGEYVVVWQSINQDASATFGIFAKRFTADGVELTPPAGVPRTGNEFRVNTHVASDQTVPSVATDTDGNFVVAWQSQSQDGDGFGVYAKRFSCTGVELEPPAGVPLGDGPSEFRVSEITAGNQVSAAVAADVDGDLVVTWEEFNGRDGSGRGVYAKRFAADGAPVGADFRVNTFTAGAQFFPEVAARRDGNFVVAWSSDEQEGVGTAGGVYAQLYTENLPPTSIGIPSVTVQQDAADTVVSLWDAFDDPNTPDDTLQFIVMGNTNAALFGGVSVNDADGTLTLDYAPGKSGQATITVRATDPRGLSVATSLVVNVTPVVSDPPVLVSTVIGDGTAQRSQVKKLTLTFDVPVALAAGALRLALLNTGSSGANDGAPPTDASVALAGPTTADGGLTWVYAFAAGAFTQSGSLADGVYAATLDRTKVTAVNGGVAMAADASFTFHRLFGDVNGSRNVNNADYIAFRSTFGKPTGDPAYVAAFDFDGGGLVNNADYIQFRNRFGKAFAY